MIEIYFVPLHDMISKVRIKQIRGLERKKNRQEERLFVAEGPKLVGELLASRQPHYVAATAAWMQQNRHRLGNAATDIVTEEELQRTSLLRNPQDVIALFPIPNSEARLADVAANELVLALDRVQDPGNLGTIVRLADWFGIHHIFCSPDSADIYNPKATQATMGALARIAIHYTDLPAALAETKAPIYGTFLNGDSLHQQSLTANGVIVMGNEGNGISKAVEDHVTHRLFIPPYPADSPTVESLNVAIATAIVCAAFRRDGQ